MLTRHLPDAIRSDNGPPFASKAVRGLSRLSIWWLKLGIHHERIQPGKPQQNGRHERMHLTLKQDSASPPAKNLSKQQYSFDTFKQEFNELRPHEALAMKAPASFYHSSDKPMPRTVSLFEYPSHYSVRLVHETGRFRWPGRHVILVGAPLSGKRIGCNQVNDDIWEIFLGPMRLGFIDITHIDLGLIRSD